MKRDFFTEQTSHHSVRATRAAECVDETSGCLISSGAHTCALFSGQWKTLGQGGAGIPMGDTLMMRGASYNEPRTIWKIMTIRNYGGTVNLGKP